MFKKSTTVAVSVNSDILILPPSNAKPLDLGLGFEDDDNEDEGSGSWSDATSDVQGIGGSRASRSSSTSSSALAPSSAWDIRPGTASSSSSSSDSSLSRFTSHSSTSTSSRDSDAGTQPRRPRRRRRSSTAVSPDHSVIRGEVSVTLLKPRPLKNVRVDLIARQHVVIDAYTHSYSIRQASASIEGGNAEVYPVGTHTFPFSMVVPSNVAPSELCPHGRTYYKLVAIVPGVHKMGRSSTGETRVTIVSTHDDGSGLPPGHSLESQLTNENLGQVYLDLSTPYLLVGGLLHFTIDMPKLNKHIKVEDVSVNVVSSYHLRALDEAQTMTTQLKPQTVCLYSMKGDPQEKWMVGGRKYAAESSFSLTGKVIQLPDESCLRPTVPEASVTGIRVTHRLAVIITYTPLEVLEETDSTVRYRELQKKEYKITSPAIFSSCRCTLEALQLPAYVQHAPDVKSASVSAQCMCTMSDAEKKALFGVPSNVTPRGRAGRSEHLTKLAQKIKREERSRFQHPSATATVNIEL